MKIRRLMIIALLYLIINPRIGFGLEVKFKQKAEISLIKGKAHQGNPHAYVTLDIQPTSVIYKKVEDWKDPAFTAEPNTIWQIVSKTSGEMPQNDWIKKIKEKLQIEPPFREVEDFTLALTASSEQVAFLIIGENYLIEVKSSTVFSNFVTYQYYERIQ